MNIPEKVNLEMGAETDRRIEALKDLVPEAFVEGELDMGRLGQVLGISSQDSANKYGLSWAGKPEAQTALQVGSVGTLRPNLDQSMNYDLAKNLIIEGDNLEVLRLLQRSYNDKIKMIYIDPPYNTGNDFIYKDDFKQGLAAYLQMTEQVSVDGRRLSSNAETTGRYHSAWLSMMYPRLALARNLLKQDGVIFVSIDDHEVHNLRLLMDEVFGPENFVASIIWQKVFSPKNTARHFSEDHDYILVYARNADAWTPGLLPRTEAQDAAYKNPDNDPRGPWASSDLSARNFYSKGTYAVTSPTGHVTAGPTPGRYWTIAEEDFLAIDTDNRVWWGPDGKGMPRRKRFLSEVMAGRVPQTLWPYTEVGHNQDAKRELLKRVTFATSDSVFDTPKPTKLVRRMLALATSKNQEDIVLDFFAGSGTTADAVIQANAEDAGNRRFIVVQTPEPTGYNDYPRVSDITHARVAAAVEEEVGAAFPEVVGTLGFRSLSLARSNFKVWESAAAPTDGTNLEEHLALFVESLSPDATDEGIVAEVILKEGLPLDARLERRTLAGSPTVIVGSQELVICLGREATDELTSAIIELGCSRVVMLEAAFTGRDAVKSNAFYRLREASITLRTA